MLRKIIKVEREVRGKKKKEIHIFLLIHYKMSMMYVITQFWVIPKKSPYFQNKNKINKIKAGNMEKAGWGIKLQFWSKFKA
jgi:hypothetical protein